MSPMLRMVQRLMCRQARPAARPPADEEVTNEEVTNEEVTNVGMADRADCQAALVTFAALAMGKPASTHAL
jgi:hypothetical protein